MGRRRRDRLARRRCRDHEPGAAVPLLLRAVCAGDGADLQGGELPPAAGLRDHADAREGTEAQQAMAQDALDRWWWPSLMMFGPPDTESTHCDAAMRLEHQALQQRRAAPAVRRHAGPAGADPRGHAARPGPDGTRNAATTTSARSTGTSSTRSSPAAVRRTPCVSPIAPRARGRRVGARGRRGRTPRRSRPPTRRWRRDQPGDSGGEEVGRCGRCSCAPRGAEPRARRVPARTGRDDGRPERPRPVHEARGGVSLWVVRASDITASDPDDRAAMFDPACSTRRSGIRRLRAPRPSRQHVRRIAATCY